MFRVGGDDGRGAFCRPRLVEQHAAAAVHLPVDQTGREHAAAQIALAPAGRTARMRHDRDDAPVLAGQRAVVDHPLAVEQPRAGVNVHHRVCVTLLRCGGLSGSRPRARAHASTSP